MLRRDRIEYIMHVYIHAGLGCGLSGPGASILQARAPSGHCEQVHTLRGKGRVGGNELVIILNSYARRERSARPEIIITNDQYSACPSTL